MCDYRFSSFLSNSILIFFFCCNTPIFQIYTLSLHDALPISDLVGGHLRGRDGGGGRIGRELWCDEDDGRQDDLQDRKSTRLNSSHVAISYAVFCLKKKTYIPIISM